MKIIFFLIAACLILTVSALVTGWREPALKGLTIIARIKIFWIMFGEVCVEMVQDSYNFFAKKFRRTRRKIETFWDRHWTRRNAFYEDGVAKDEFDNSLEMDGAAMLDMSREEVDKYMLDLVKRRDKAHQRDMEMDQVTKPLAKS